MVLEKSQKWDGKLWKPISELYKKGVLYRENLEQKLYFNHF